MQLGSTEELLRKWRGRSVVLLNPAWADGKNIPSKDAAFVKSFEVVYCFQPIAIQVSLERGLDLLIVSRCLTQKLYINDCVGWSRLCC